MSAVEVLRHPDAEALAESASARIVTTVVAAQTSAGHAHLCLTGGGIGIAVLAALASSPGRDAIDWTRVDLWWGDERYLSTGNAERNETQARAALIDHLNIASERVHPMPAPENSSGDVDAAAAAYAHDLRAAARPEDHADVPTFDITLLGIGPDAHVASLFPELPALHDTRSCTAVRGAPKPPPVRVTLTLPALNASREVWILASGEEKATAIYLALTSQAGAYQVPASGVRGRERTLFLIDEAAASKLPRSMGRPVA